MVTTYYDKYKRTCGKYFEKRNDNEGERMITYFVCAQVLIDVVMNVENSAKLPVRYRCLEHIAF